MPGLNFKTYLKSGWLPQFFLINIRKANPIQITKLKLISNTRSMESGSLKYIFN